MIFKETLLYDKTNDLYNAFGLEFPDDY